MLAHLFVQWEPHLFIILTACQRLHSIEKRLGYCETFAFVHSFHSDLELRIGAPAQNFQAVLRYGGDGIGDITTKVFKYMMTSNNKSLQYFAP